MTRSPHLEAQDLAELSLWIHVNREDPAAATHGEVGGNVRDEGGFAAASLFIDEGNSTRNVSPRSGASRDPQWVAGSTFLRIYTPYRYL